MTKQAKRQCTLFYILTIFYWFSFYSSGSTLPTHAQNLGANETMIGLIVGSYGFAQMFLRIPLGMLSDRLDKRKIFIGIGLGLSFISCIGLGLSKTPMMLLIFRFLSGVAVASWVVFLGYATTTLKQTDTHKVTGLLNAFGKTGRMLALIIGSMSAFLIATSWSFYVGGLFGLVGLILWFKIPNDQKNIHHEKIKIRVLFSVVKDRNLLISAIITAFFQFAVFATVYTFIPIYAKTLGMNDFLIGILTATFTLTGIISALLSGTLLKKKFGVRNTMVVAFLITGIIYLFIPYITSIPLLFIAQLTSGFFMGMVLPMLMAQSIKTIEPKKVSTAMGFYQAIYSLGMFLGPYIVGAIIDKSSMEKGFFVVFIVCIVSSVGSYLYKRSDIKNGRLA